MITVTPGMLDTLSSMLKVPASEPYLTTALTLAATQVATLTTPLNVVTTPPHVVLERAVLDVAADVWARRNITNGLATFEDATGTTAMRVRTDVLDAARPHLAPYMAGVIA